ncbi:hypothetical protein ABW20_dc0100579 [Dactylellina cionopaga]|nr:hypothetical protein ABW20_dc0100579 [Dactylellina cionopaga]
MLKTKPLNALLSQSLSEHVSSVILFTPSGNLLASSAPPNSTDAKKARVHAALAANIWSTYERVATDGLLQKALPAQDGQSSSSSTSAPSGPAPTTATGSSNHRSASGTQDHVKTLTVELTEYNLHLQAVSPRILLGMIGMRQGTGHPSSSSSQHSNEGSDHDPGIGASRGIGPSLRPSVPGTGGPTSATGSGGIGGGGAMGVLKVTSQTLVDYLRKELKDFEPPEDL